MAAGPRVGHTNAVTLVVKKGASTASLSLVRYDDGQIEYTRSNGVKVKSNDPTRFIRLLFTDIAALV